MSKNVLIKIEYDGTDFRGWQIQPDVRTVQGEIEHVLKYIAGEEVHIHGTSRTDAGVHAVAMTAHFDIDDTHDANTVMRALNFYLNNKPVSVLDCEIVSDEFNARFDCVARHYKYVVLNRSASPVLDKNRVYWVPRPLNVDAMKNAAQKLLGNHDFTSFRASECQAKSPVKTLDKIEITQNGDEIIFEFSARSFLHHMVRNIVGTLIEIGLGKPYDVDDVLNAKNRSAAGPTAPSDGLYFMRADY
jgi:tRNA pseudouridine38-40 synthase